MTRGYSLAFQITGYLYWEALSKCDSSEEINWEEINQKLDALLSELAYDKIWSELSVNDIKVLTGMLEARKASGMDMIKVEAIRDIIGMTSDNFTKYRSRLIDNDILDGATYGCLRFKLPRFEQYIEQKMLQKIY